MMTKRARLLWRVIRRVGFDKAIYGFLAWFLLGAAVILLAEPGIVTAGDSLWYLFVASTSIGFGDLVAVTFAGRVITVITTVYEIVLVAMFSGVVVSYYLEVVHRRENETLTLFLDRLEHISEMDKEELIEIENKIKEIRG